MKRLKKPLILLVILGLLLIGIAAFFILNSKPDVLTDAEKEEKIAEMLGRKANLNPEIKKGNGKFNGEYVSFSYPASAEEYEYRDPGIANNENLLESFSFDLQNPRRILNYTVSKSSARELEDIPAIKLRLDVTRGYKEENEEVDGVEGLVFSKERSGEYLAEKSLFLLTDGNIYTISITGSSLMDIEKLYNQIINTFVFH